MRRFLNIGAVLIAALAAPLVLRAQEGDDSSSPAASATPATPATPEATVTNATATHQIPGIRNRFDAIRNPGRANALHNNPGTTAAGPLPAASTTAAAPTPGTTSAPVHNGAEPSPTSTTQKIGNGLMETNPKSVKPLPWDSKVSLGNIDDTDLEEVIKTISRATAHNFVYDKKDVKNQKVTILAPTALTVEEAYKVFQSVLEGAGLTLIRDGNVWRITPRRDAKEKALDTSVGPDVPWNDSFVTRIIRLQNIDVAQIQTVVQQLAAKDGLVQSFAPTNSLIITDTANNIRRLSRIIEDLDKSGGSEDIEVMKIKYADVTDLAEKINQLFGVAAAAAPGAHPPQGGLRRQFGKQPGGATPAAATSAGELDTNPLITKVIADVRTSQLIVQANDRAMQALTDFLAKVDVPALRKGGTIHVYRLENADAEEVATVLSNLATGNRNNQQGRPGQPGQGGNNQNGFINGNAPAGQPQTPSTSGAGPAGAGPVASITGDVRVTSDKATNSLVITASESDYAALEDVIIKLDKPRRQVYVEAVIMEMDVNRERDLGFDWGVGAPVAGGIGYGGLNASNALFPNVQQLATGFALGLLGPGGVNFSIPSTTPGGAPTIVTVPPFGVVLNALETNSDINVISRPNVLAKENEEAEVIVATSVAIPGNVTISQTGLQNFSITHEDVGITLKVTPKINNTDHLSLNIFQEVKNIVKDQTVNGQRLVDTGKRSAKTSVVVKNGETVVIGGLIDDHDTKTESKIPLLGDIPILGFLFRSTTHVVAKQNLVIFLTPTIIRDETDMQRIYQNRLKEREMFMKMYMMKGNAKDSKKSLTLFERYYGASTEGVEADQKKDKTFPMLFEPVDHPIQGPAWVDPTSGPQPTPTETPYGRDNTLNDMGVVQPAGTAVPEATPEAAPSPTPTPPPQQDMP